MGVLAAVILRHQSINGTPRNPGEYLTKEEYDAIPVYVRDAMESNLDIKTIFNDEAFNQFAELEERVARLEKLFEGELNGASS